MPRFYRRNLTNTLLSVVSEDDCSPAEAVSLYEELALTRVAVGEAVTLYNAAFEARAKCDPKDHAKLDSVCHGAAGMMIEGFKHVEHFCTAIARIEAVSKDKINIHTLHGCMRQVVRLMYEVCGEEHQALAEKFETLVKTQVVIPATNTAQGTNMTPDQLDLDVLGMDESIP